eukprot:scaffold81804_cov49-Phaeocystis_antarctica.AAC.3
MPHTAGATVGLLSQTSLVCGSTTGDAFERPTGTRERLSRCSCAQARSRRCSKTGRRRPSSARSETRWRRCPRSRRHKRRSSERAARPSSVRSTICGTYYLAPTTDHP